MYKKIDASQNIVDREKQLAQFWNENDIIQKNFDMNKEGQYFTFYDGPPTANGKPHVGHVLTRVMKDIIPRYKVMKGYKVLRKAGWDTHGLPVELEIEKKLGISGKGQIEEYGVEKFIKECKNSVFQYTSLWKDMSEKLGFWVDMDNPYVTYHDNYIESVWWALKEMWKKDLLYQGHKVMPYCPRCETALSSHEVAQGYKDVKESTAVVKFKVKNEINKYFLAWTTTPWTLPSNIALTINKKYDYIEAEQNGEIYIIAKELASKVLGDEYSVVKEFKGQEILGMEYEQLFKFETPAEKAFYVIHGDFVTLTDGTGLVHTAPAYGEDDNRVCNQNNMPSINLVDKSGCFVDSVEPWKGMFVKKADAKIIEYMNESGMLYKEEKHTHSYPHCWRCDTPLLYYPKDSWFVRTTSVKDNLIKNNNSINWLPNNIKTGRMGKFLENNIDWSISRDRYWGTPLPIWECECGHKECIGSRAELMEKGINVEEGIEFHKPYIDEVKLSCPHCGKLMTRTKEVIDCWFDSGSMPFAQHHYPFENKEIFEQNFPAQFISEAVDQTRGWFYTLEAISTTLFDKAPFENCIVLGHVLDKKGVKMSKHKGNVVDPFNVLENEGADATRWHFYTASAPWLPTRFSEDDVAETGRRFLGTLWNVYSFYILYAEIDKFNPTKYENFVSHNVMDKWIISKLNSLNKSIDKKLNDYGINQAAIEIEGFVDELSNWYVRRNRSRFWSETLTNDKIGAYITLHKVLVDLCKILAPFVPFITDEIYQNLVVNLDETAPISIHLCTWPECNEQLINKDLEEEMDLAYKVVKLGRAARNNANIKNRQPLAKMLLSTNVIPEYYGDIIKDELNIKAIEFGADVSKYVSFEIKPNLPVLGKAYGKLIPQIKKAIAGENQMTLASKIAMGENFIVNVEGQEIELNSQNLLVNMKGLEGFAFSGEGDIGVLLDTTITDELKEEGHVREILSKIQNMRKDSGFKVDDKINLYVTGNPMLEDIISKYEDTIKKETLTVNISFNDVTDYKDVKINGEMLRLDVKVVK